MSEGLAADRIHAGLLQNLLVLGRELQHPHGGQAVGPHPSGKGPGEGQSGKFAGVGVGISTRHGNLLDFQGINQANHRMVGAAGHRPVGRTGVHLKEGVRKTTCVAGRSIAFMRDINIRIHPGGGAGQAVVAVGHHKTTDESPGIREGRPGWRSRNRPFVNQRGQRFIRQLGLHADEEVGRQQEVGRLGDVKYVCAVHDMDPDRHRGVSGQVHIHRRGIAPVHHHTIGPQPCETIVHHCIGGDGERSETATGARHATLWHDAVGRLGSFGKWTLVASVTLATDLNRIQGGQAFLTWTNDRNRGSLRGTGSTGNRITTTRGNRTNRQPTGWESGRPTLFGIEGTLDESDFHNEAGSRTRVVRPGT